MRVRELIKKLMEESDGLDDDVYIWESNADDVGLDDINHIREVNVIRHPWGKGDGSILLFEYIPEE